VRAAASCLTSRLEQAACLTRRLEPGHSQGPVSWLDVTAGCDGWVSRGWVSRLGCHGWVSRLGVLAGFQRAQVFQRQDVCEDVVTCWPCAGYNV